jgi:hypothetical protein
VTIQLRQVAVVRILLSALTAITLLGTQPVLACPEETITQGPFTVRQFKGRILPLGDDELLPHTPVQFTVREKDNEHTDRWDVPVAADGTFQVGLRDGVYEFTVHVDGYLFTLVGDVTISSDAAAENTIMLYPNWC